MRDFWCNFASNQFPNGWICNFSNKTFGLQRDIWLCPISFTVLLSPPCNTADLVQDIWCGFKIPPIERYGPLNSTGYRLTPPYTPNIADRKGALGPNSKTSASRYISFCFRFEMISFSATFVLWCDVPIVVNGHQMWIQYQLLSRIKRREDKAWPNLREKRGRRGVYNCILDIKRDINLLFFGAFPFLLKNLME